MTSKRIHAQKSRKLCDGMVETLPGLDHRSAAAKMAIPLARSLGNPLCARMMRKSSEEWPEADLLGPACVEKLWELVRLPINGDGDNETSLQEFKLLTQ